MFWGFFEIYLISSSFSHYEQICGFTLGEKFSVGLSNCYVSTGTFWGEFFVKRTKTISYRLPVFERTFFGPLATKFWQVRQKWNPRVQRSNCGLFRKRYTFFLQFRNMSKKLSTFWQEIFGRLVKKAIWVSTGVFWEGTTFLKRVYILFDHFWTSNSFF